MIKNTNPSSIILMLTGFFAFALLANVSFPDESNQFYMENLYLPLGLMILLPVIFDLMGEWSWGRQLILLAIIFGLRVIHIHGAHDTFTDRLNWMRSYLEENRGSKLMVDESRVPMDILMMSWASSYEFWLLSTIEQGKTERMIIHKDVKEIEWARGENHHFILNWGSYDIQDLPERYFNFEEDSTNYKILLKEN